MIIKKLIVRAMAPNERVLRTIKFNPKGLNLIVDETENSDKTSGNSVGKTTTIKVIDLCLGAKNIKSLYRDEDTKNENYEVKQFLDNNQVQAELVLCDEKDNELRLKRDLYTRGKRYINDEQYTEKEFDQEMAKLMFGLNASKPTYRQLMNKFIRIDNTSADGMIRFLNQGTTKVDYDTIYCFLFRLYDEELSSKKNELQRKLKECENTIKVLEKSNGNESINSLVQQLEIINSDIEQLEIERNQLSYLDEYSAKLEHNRFMVSEINNLQDKIKLIEYEINNINESINELEKSKEQVNCEALQTVYKEAKSYIPQLQKEFSDMVEFHNVMIENRIEFIANQLRKKKSEHMRCIAQQEQLIEEKKKFTIDSLDEGMFDEFNAISMNIENNLVKKGEIQKAIELLSNQEEEKGNINKALQDVDSRLDGSLIDEKIKSFNRYFINFCEQLYGEKYMFVYNKDWENKKNGFPVSVSALQGGLGTGKKKGVIVAFDLAYMQYSKKNDIKAPAFVIHDKMENTHINQIRTIFELCNSINGQYIIPILRERISNLSKEIVDDAVILTLSEKDKFFTI